MRVADPELKTIGAGGSIGQHHMRGMVLYNAYKSPSGTEKGTDLPILVLSVGNKLSRQHMARDMHAEESNLQMKAHSGGRAHLCRAMNE